MEHLFMAEATVPAGLHWDSLYTGMFLLVFASVAVYSLAIPQGDRRWWGLAALLGGLVIAGQVAGAGFTRLILLDGAALAAVALVWVQDTPQARSSAQKYLQLLLLAMVLIGLGLYLGGEGATAPALPLDKLAVALLLIGFGLKLALVPFYFWLPGIAESASPMTTALIVSVVDIAAFGELAHLRLTAPWVFADYTTLWLAVALLSMLGGALLALAQTNLKRMLAFSTIDDMGYMILGVAVGSEVGLTGAILAALAHALFKVLLFGAVGLVEHQRGRAITLADRGLASAYPLSAAIYVVGALGILGVPPLFGFAGRWRLYMAGAQFGGIWLAAIMALATAIALLYYARSIHQIWWGQSDSGSAAEPLLPAAVLLGLAIFTVILGLYPGWITAIIG